MTDNQIPEEDRIYAGELRAAGMELDQKIPDCAWIPRYALKPITITTEDTKEDAKKMRTLPSVRIELEVTEPFRWVEVKGTIDLNQGVIT